MKQTTEQEVFRMIERLEDLKKQATVEHSHFYVDSTITQTIALLYDLVREHYAET